MKKNDRHFFLQLAIALALITIFYNVVEGLVSVYFGMEDETLALMGFGLDSFVETISGLGILHMIWRMKRNQGDDPDNFERAALKVTGFSFYLLSAGLAISVIFNIVTHQPPETTLWGIIIAVISIITMWMLIRAKIFAGKNLNSSAIIADANCTKVCLQMSVVLLISAILYESFHIMYFDSIGAAGIIWFAVREGNESFAKAKGKTCGCHDDHGASG